MNLFGALRSPRNIVFGAGQRMAAARYVAALGKRVMIITDARQAADATFAVLVSELAAQNLDVKVFSGVDAELPVACVEKGRTITADFAPNVMLGIGGGSCIDAAKLIALLVTHGGSLSSYYGEFKVPGPVLPLIAIPTTSGTGSEVTPVAVVADPERAVKVGVASPHLIPHTAICDPELTYSCPPALTAVSGADALTHAIEAVTTLRRQTTFETTHEHVFVGKNAMSDHFALGAIGHIGANLRRAYQNGSDIEARQSLMFGSLLAGLAFGTAGTAAAHAVQYPVGALTGTPHGAGVAVMLPYVMAFNSSASLSAMAQVAFSLGIGDGAVGEQANAVKAIDFVADLFAAIGIPANLRDLGLAAADLEWTVTQALAATRLVKNNPRPLDKAAMSTLVKAAFDGSRSELYAANS